MVLAGALQGNLKERGPTAPRGGRDPGAVWQPANAALAPAGLQPAYANRRRIELARALALKPQILLLGEPTAGMNPTETAEMLAFIRQLKQRGLTILLIEHKLSLVMQLSDQVIVMDNGKIIAEGKPELVRYDLRVIEAYLGHSRPIQPQASYTNHPDTQDFTPAGFGSPQVNS